MTEKPPPVATAADEWARIRHDLRTPINQIIGYSELIQEQLEERGQTELVSDLKKIQTAARNQLEIIDTFLVPAAAGPPPASPPAGDKRPEAASQAVSPGGPTQTALTGTVLVVDDNEMNRDMLSRRLSAKGFSVAVAEDGQKALHAIEAQRFDLVLLDVMMPGISGLDVLKNLRQRHASGDLPVIMATAKDASEDIVEALKLGANDYVTKPLDFPVVMARVQAQLALKRQKDQIHRLAEDLERRNRFIRNTFGRYLSDDVVEGLLESPEGLKLGGESRKVTILMSDLRGFTSVSERLNPEQVVRMLNNYLGAMAEVILQHQGTIDEFIGDAILAIFGAPVKREDDARRALACAIRMQQAMDAVNERNAREGLPRLEMGIAVHTGSVVVGNIGSQQRTKYGIVGPPVNNTGRIESYTVGGQILVSEATLADAGPIVSVGERIHVKAKGARAPIVVHDLRGIGGEYNVSLPQKEVRLLHLPAPVRLRYSILDEKRVGDDLFEGSLVKLSGTAGEICSDDPLRLLSNIKVQILREDGVPVPGDLYAKVMDARGSDGRCCLVRFTSVPPDVGAFLRELLATSSAEAGV